MKKRPQRIISLLCIGLVLILIAGFFVYVNISRNSPAVSTIPAASGISMALPASLTLIAPSGSTATDGTVDVGQPQHVTWISTNYAAPTVSINIIRKVSDNPARYELVRTVAQAMSNRGNALWIPTPADAGTDTFIQIGCTASAQACQASPVVTSAPLAVLDTGLYDNTASAYDTSFEAAEALYNK